MLLKRLRSTDELGWYDHEKLAALLPYTPFAGADQLASEVISALRETGSVNYEVQSYPERGGDTPQGRSPGSGSGKKPRESVRGVRALQMAPKGNNGTARRAPTLKKASPEDSVPVGRVFSPVPCTPTPFWKRVLDIFVSVVALILLAPLFLAVSVFIKVVSSGPVFFRQERVGANGKPFTIWKFRTMHQNADTSSHREYVQGLIQQAVGSGNGDGAKPMRKLQNDPRIIPFGNLLRKSAIDELPQIFNVLRGEMSIVGPRPCIAYEADGYLPWYRKRFNTVPGMTGLWQVTGKNERTVTEMMRLDINYAMHRSVLLDLKIIFKTPRVIAGEVLNTLRMRKMPSEARENT
jgi:lipopolysaccharide/colanic/teichoic acid biosynthesis glycosyltransferase